MRKIIILVTRFLIPVIVLSTFTGCAYLKHLKQKAGPKPAHKTPAKTPSRAAPKPVDLQAQQKYYDLGLKYYSEENYAEAKKAWQQVLQLGSHTPLSEKAGEYLKKTDQVLKTLNEIEKK